MNSQSDGRPLVVHIVFRFDYGGLENGVVNVLRGLAGDELRHAVVALTEATEFADRLPNNVDVHSIGKQPGKDPRAYARLFRLLRQLKPRIVHSRNVGTIDCALVAFMARVPVRIHSEHGWDIFDPDGASPKYRWIRRLMNPFIHRFVTVSEDLAQWLENTVGIARGKIECLRNGVDTGRFSPQGDGSDTVLPEALRGEENVVVGSVTRFSAIKDPLNLINAFHSIVQQATESVQKPVLVMAGAGELLSDAREVLKKSDLEARSWLPGARDDIPQLMRAMDVFVLGSLREGISNTILEAMACGLPIVACNTGGNPELVAEGVNGFLVPPGDAEALSVALGRYIDDPELRQRHGLESRRRAEREFSMAVMIQRYRSLYNDTLAKVAA